MTLRHTHIRSLKHVSQSERYCNLSLYIEYCPSPLVRSLDISRALTLHDCVREDLKIISYKTPFCRHLKIAGCQVLII